MNDQCASDRHSAPSTICSTLPSRATGCTGRTGNARRHDLAAVRQTRGPATTPYDTGIGALGGIVTACRAAVRGVMRTHLRRDPHLRTESRGEVLQHPAPPRSCRPRWLAGVRLTSQHRRRRPWTPRCFRAADRLARQACTTAGFSLLCVGHEKRKHGAEGRARFG